MWKRHLIAVVVLVGLCRATFAAQDAGRVDFGRDVQPILRQQCYSCHGAAQQMSGFRLDRRRDAMRGSTASPGIIRPGNSEASLLFFRIAGSAAGPQMPPTGKLSAADISLWMTDAKAMTARAKSTRKPEMKSYTLPKDELDALVAYMASLKKK